MSLTRSLILVVALAVVFGACKDSTSTNDGGGTNATDTSRLVLTKTGPDTLYGVPGSSVTVSFHVTRSGKPVDSAAVSYFDPVTGSSLISDRTVGGAVTVTLDIPSTTTSGNYPARFFATKRDVPMSDTIRMVLHVDGRATLKMSLRARGELGGIGLLWTRTASDHGVDTATLVSQSGAVSRALVAAPGAEAHFTGLNEGEVYTLYVNSTEALSEHIQWALSKRYGPRRVTEGEGIDLASGNVMSAAADPSPVDVILATDPTSVGLVSLISPAFTKLSKLTHGRNTQFSDFYVYGQALDSIYFQRDLSTKFDSDVNMIELDEEYHPSLIFQVLTADKHYAQIGVIPQPNGHLIGIDASKHRFVDLQVSYQTIANLPYARRVSSRMTRRIVAHELGKR